MVSANPIFRVFPASMRSLHFFHLAVKRSIVNQAASEQTGKGPPAGHWGGSDLEDINRCLTRFEIDNSRASSFQDVRPVRMRVLEG
jgi:hypothetical protein